MPKIDDSLYKAIAELSCNLIDEEYRKGNLVGVVEDSVDLPREVAPFLKGMEIGTGYALIMILTGKLDLRLLEIDKP